MYFNKEIECMSRSEKEALQSERLINVVKRVYDNVKMYRAKMDAIKLKPSDIKSIKDIYKLPYTVKQDLRDSYPFGMFAVPKRDIVRLHASSATTGKLTVVGYTKNDLDTWAECDARALVMAGATPDSTVHVAYGYGLFTGGLGMHYGTEKLGATVVPVSSGNTKRQLMLMKDFEADILCCTPSYAIFLAEEMEKEGYSLKDFNLKAGIFGAEAWTEEMRKTIENRLNIKAIDIYGLSEICGPGVACECSEQTGMHIQDDYFFPEIISTDTLEPLPIGEEGELVFTTLTKEGIPLIRYRTRDLCSLNDTPCACGRTSIKMNKVFARSDDMLIIRGVNVFPSQIESVLLSNPLASPHYHIVVDRVNNLDVLEIQVEMSEALFSDEVKAIENFKNKLAQDMASAISVSAKITLVSPHSIERSEGKAKRITDKRFVK
ncbi:MAG: phenylacetate--CoA ligase [Clostridiales bacterium]|nr:phenylacetate--CoA ligase [Clostridiales bacterium]